MRYLSKSGGGFVFRTIKITFPNVLFRLTVSEYFRLDIVVIKKGDCVFVVRDCLYESL